MFFWGGGPGLHSKDNGVLVAVLGCLHFWKLPPETLVSFFVDPHNKYDGILGPILGGPLISGNYS